MGFSWLVSRSISLTEQNRPQVHRPLLRALFFQPSSLHPGAQKQQNRQQAAMVSSLSGPPPPWAPPQPLSSLALPKKAGCNGGLPITPTTPGCWC